MQLLLSILLMFHVAKCRSLVQGDCRFEHNKGVMIQDRALSTGISSPAPSSPVLLLQHTRKAFLLVTTSTLFPFASDAKCRDIESCREIGEQKDAENLAKNPIVRLGNGLQYKVLSLGLGNAVVTENSQIKIIYSISQANGSYMYSQGFGYNKIDAGNGKMVSDLNLDALPVQMGSNEVPVGIQKALIGARRGERRRIECPAALGFETSNWKPEPSSFRGKRQVIDYRSTLTGRGDTQPPFPAPTLWDVEVVSIR